MPLRAARTIERRMGASETIELGGRTSERVGFPPPLLGPEPWRLPVGSPAAGLLALALPGGMLSDADPLYPDRPTVVGALQAQLRAGKPELERLGMEVALGVNFVEPECGGVLLVAVTRAAVDRWRNALGSGQLRFYYYLVTWADPAREGVFECDLPLARHRREARMLVSHQTGKQAFTSFRRLSCSGELELWEATTAFPRIHQIRLHAHERGLAVPGERLYGETALLEGRLAAGLNGCLPLWLGRVEAPGTVGFSAVVARPGKRGPRVWCEFADF